MLIIYFILVSLMGDLDCEEKLDICHLNRSKS